MKEMHIHTAPQRGFIRFSLSDKAIKDKTFSVKNKTIGNKPTRFYFLALLDCSSSAEVKPKSKKESYA